MTVSEEVRQAVWAKLKVIAYEAAPGSLTPNTVCRVVVDMTFEELRKRGCLVGIVHAPGEEA